MTDSVHTSTMAGKRLKILIVDDESFFLNAIGACAKMLGYSWRTATDFEEAMLAIKEAEQAGEPFSVVTLDMNFGKGEAVMPMGKMLLQTIKTEYPHLACVMISGSITSPHEVLDLRDDYDLDYYISKSKLDQDTLERGIRKALGRVRPWGNVHRQRKILQETLARYQDICNIYAHNLALAEEKKASKGVNVGVDTENEIRAYRTQLEEAQAKVAQLKKEVDALEILPQ